MLAPRQGKEDEHLDGLFQAYRQACPDPEPGRNFMPELWERIEARRKFARIFRRIAGGLATAAAALSLVIAVSLPSAGVHGSHYFAQSYVEALDDSHAADSQYFYEPVHADVSDDAATIDLL